MLRALDMTDIPRDLGMSIELTEGTGPILAMCLVGDILEVYKVDRCFELYSPDSVDPYQVDPNTPWIIKQVSSFGACNDIVARTFLQADAIIREVSLKGSVDKKAVVLSARSCRNSILECKKLSSRINEEIDRIAKEYQVLELSGNVITSFPTYQGLREVAGSFLLHAKQCLQNVARIFNAFFATSLIALSAHRRAELHGHG